MKLVGNISEGHDLLMTTMANFSSTCHDEHEIVTEYPFFIYLVKLTKITIAGFLHKFQDLHISSLNVFHTSNLHISKLT